MNILRKLHAKLNLHSQDDELIYSLVAQEVENGAILQGLWTKAHAFSDFDEGKAKAYYIRHRAEQLTEHRDRIISYVRLQEKLSHLEHRLAGGTDAEYQAIQRQLVKLDKEVQEIETVASHAAETARIQGVEKGKKRRRRVALTSLALIPAIYFPSSLTGHQSFGNIFTIIMASIALLYIAYSIADNGEGAAFSASERKRNELGVGSLYSKKSKLKFRLKDLSDERENASAQLQQLKSQVTSQEQQLAHLFPYAMSEVVA